jgi:hypothetical protein
MDQDNTSLVGRKFWGWGRAADLASFQIGEKRKVTGHRGESKTVGHSALHIQCPWRITQGERLVVASGDLYYPPDGSAAGPDFDWEPLGANRRDVILDRLFGASELLVIQDFKLGPAGLLRIMLTDSVCLEVFPDASVDREHWRLFEPYTDRPHIVATGGSIREEPG